MPLADNLNPTAGTGTVPIRFLSDGTNEWAASVVAFAPTIAGGANVLQIVNAGNPLPVTDAALEAASVAQGTAAPTKIIVVGGKSNDGTAQYREIPEGPGGRSVIVEGFAGGVAVPVTGTFWQATQPVSGTIVVGAGSAVIGHVIVDSGTITIGAAIPAGSNVIGHVINDTGSTTAVTGNVTVVQATGSNLHTVIDAGANTIGNVVPVAGTTGGATPFRYIIAAGTNQDSQNVKASAGTLYSIDAFLNVATLRYLKLYDKASAPTSADTPVHTFLIPGNTAGAGFTKSIPVGIAFASGISFRVTTGLADNDTGAATANDGVINLDYK